MLVPVHREHGQLWNLIRLVPGLVVQYGYGVQGRRRAESLRLVRRPGHGRMRYRSPAVPAGQRERMENRLPPGRAVRLCPDSADHIHQLGQAGYPQPVGVAEQADQQAVGDDRVNQPVLVLNQPSCGIRAPRAQVHRQHRRHAGAPCPAAELVGAYLVPLGGMPGEVEPHRPVLHGSDAVFPAVSAHEVPARVPDCGNTEFPGQVGDIAPEPVLVRRGCSGW